MQWNAVVALVCTLLGAVVGYATFARNKTKDDKTNGQQTGVMLTELGYIKSGLDTINSKMDKQEERNLDMVERLSTVESSVKQAHRRLDDLTKEDWKCRTD